MRKTLTTLVLSLSLNAFAQIPVATQTLLDGVKSPESRGVIKSVLMIVCRKEGGKGTGFVLSGGEVVTTNAHVVGTCSAEELEGVSAVSNEQVKFLRMRTDPNRDLALLCATKPLPFSLALNGDGNPPVDTEVETWGYPLRYEGSAPILSRGYVAGYTEGRDEQNEIKNPPVRHLIVNGALNPGNSGGPLIDRSTGKVIGVVVEKWRLFSPFVELAITALQHSPTGTGSAMSYTDPSGKTVRLMNEQITAAALKEVYDKSQVMVGEAISVSELNAFIKEKKKDLACGSK